MHCTLVELDLAVFTLVLTDARLGKILKLCIKRTLIFLSNLRYFVEKHGLKADASLNFVSSQDNTSKTFFKRSLYQSFTINWNLSNRFTYCDLAIEVYQYSSTWRTVCT